MFTKPRHHLLSFILCGTLLLHPVQLAYAADDNSVTTQEDTSTTQEDTATTQPDEAPFWENRQLEITLLSKRSLSLSWSTATNAISYQVYRKDCGSTPIATVTEPCYTDHTISFGHTYQYSVVPVGANNLLGDAISATTHPRNIVNVTRQAYSYKEMESDGKALSELYPDRCEITSIGSTVKGRKLYDIAIGNPNATNSLLVVCTLHAREYACSVLAMRQLEYYLQNYNRTLGGIKPSTTLSNLQIHYLVMANPDGVTISQGKHPRWKANARGVDLNRNYPYLFHVSGHPGSEGFTGYKAASEPETKAIMKKIALLKKTQHLRAVVNYHAMGQIIFGDYHGPNAAIKKETKDLYWMARNLTGYKDSGSYGGVGRGCLREYLLYKEKIPNITIEIGRTWCPVVHREYNQIFNKNKLVVLKAASFYKNKSKR
ncbi:Zinc carboxypeptidase [Lachnospiraceae bacterium XBB1006]|nr:Zinc carboxypeptidase [Lachnospiraceae bacterium XBB1006]